VNSADPLHYYGADAAAVKKLAEENEAWKEQLHPGFPYIKAQVIWAVRNEMAMTVEDVLSRRIRMLFLDARAAIQAAPEVARLMAEEMGKDENWLQDQLQNFTALAEGYLLGM
jgi:glycerol-3-phosphate dehydrogenase